MPEEHPTSPGGPPAQPPAAAGEVSREERIAAAKARAEALKAQRAAGTPPQAGAAPAAPAAPARPTAGGFKPPVASKNPGGAPVVAPQQPTIRAFGTLTQAVEITCEATEEPNLAKILGGLGLYKNPLRGVWQLDYRYYAEAVRRLQSAGYQVDGEDYLGRPLAQWVAEARGWTKLE